MMSEGGHSSVRAVVVMNIKEQPYASAYPQEYSQRLSSAPQGVENEFLLSDIPYHSTKNKNRKIPIKTNEGIVEDIESDRENEGKSQSELEFGSPNPVSAIKKNLMEPKLNSLQIQEVGY